MAARLRDSDSAKIAAERAAATAVADKVEIGCGHIVSVV